MSEMVESERRVSSGPRPNSSLCTSPTSRSRSKVERGALSSASSSSARRETSELTRSAESLVSLAKSIRLMIVLCSRAFSSWNCCPPTTDSSPAGGRPSVRFSLMYLSLRAMLYSPLFRPSL